MQAAIDGPTLFIDARSRAEFADGHVSGAVNIPYSEVKKGTHPLRLILYCDSRECAMAENLLVLLRERGVELVVMPEGLKGWFQVGGLLEAGK
ncbi:MAG: rhodanese-like domain-containing protein [Desulfovibrionaceae bacterium]